MQNTTDKRLVMIERRQLTIDPSFRHRAVIDNDTHVAALRKSLRNTGRLDPILIWQERNKKVEETGRLVLLDGHFRVAAYDIEQASGKIDGKGIPAVLLKGSRMEADLAALGANVKDVQPLTMNERTDAAWALVQRYRQALSKSRLARASGVSERTIARMRQQLRKFVAEGQSPSGSWWQDRKFPEEAAFTPPTDAEREELIGNLAEAIQGAVRENRTSDIEVLAEGLQRGLGQRQMVDIADYLQIGGHDWDEFAQEPDEEHFSDHFEREPEEAPRVH